MTADLFGRRLEALRLWWDEYGSSQYASADDWINSMSNTQLLEALSWVEGID